MRAIWLVCALIAVGALFLPIVPLAKMTSAILLLVFSLVNLALWLIGQQDDCPRSLRRWRYWGLVAFAFSACLLVLELYRLVTLA